MGPADLEEVMESINVINNANVIVGLENSDDAGVYRISSDIAIIQTLDFFTPIVDDPYKYGQIAVTNGLSDVYSMGGKPITAMNIVCFPCKKFSLDILKQILKGGLDVLTRAGVQLLGGHSVDDNEMKYGVSVTGVIHPDRVIKNCGLKNGDALILTKPLGTGVIGTVVKAGMAEDDVINSFVKIMSTLNDKPSEIMQRYEVHACTDVTGFGLIGHLKEMLSSDSYEIVVESRQLPLIPGAIENISMGLIPEGMYRNRDFIGDLCIAESSAKGELVDIAFDPQTSGGLLIGLPEKNASNLLSELQSSGVNEAKIIALVRDSDSQRIRIV